MTDKTPLPGNAPGLPEHVTPINNVLDAMDDLHTANDLMELVFMAANSERQDSIARGVGIAQESLRAALTCLEQARLTLGGLPIGAEVAA